VKFELIEEKAGLKLIKLNIFNDERGKYIKLFSKEELKTLGIENEFVDDNYLISKKGSIRGLHCQIKNPEAKLLSCIEGKILDIVVDLRETSETYKQFFTFELDSKENKILYIPEGFAHGFLSLEDSKVIYKSSNYYFAEDQYGISIFSEKLKINEILKRYKIEEILITEKDKKLEII
jgi:dTDP-4-dehydrorhamnose 3,5-epimerase